MSTPLTSPTAATPYRHRSGLRARWRGLQPAARRGLVLSAAVVLGLHVVGFAVLLAVVAPGQGPAGPGHVFGVGLGLTAYMLGVRHAFDADHIAAIDNTTRKLVSEGQRPVTVGLWFSLGHSSVVFAMCALLALGVQAAGSAISDEDSTLHQVTSIWGPSVSAVFLLALGLVNAAALVGIVRVFIGLRRGSFDEARLEGHLAHRGLMFRVVSKITKPVTKAWHMYPTGVLFGFGFDTATEVSLLVLAGGAAAFALPWEAIMVLPVLFTAGMALFDAADGAFMSVAYGWAEASPVRKVYYNMTTTGLSVLVAMGIGGLGAVSVLTEQFAPTGRLASLAGAVDLDHVGYVTVALFVLAWVISVAFWRLGRVEQRWQTRLASDQPPTDPAPMPVGCP